MSTHRAYSMNAVQPLGDHDHKVVIGVLRPTGAFETQDSTDPRRYSDSNPTEDAQVDVDRSDSVLSGQHDEQVETRGNWRVLPDAEWGEDKIQAIAGPFDMVPARRDYGMQDGRKIRPGHGSWSQGRSLSTSLEDGIVATESRTQSGVTTNSESRSLSSNPGIKGIGNLGVSIDQSNAESLANSTGTGLSVTSTSSESTSIEFSHSVTMKPEQHQ